MTRITLPYWLRFGVFVSIALATGCSHGNRNSAASSSWKSAPGLTDSLAPEVPLGDFAMRPPSGYTLSETPMTARDGKGEVCIFTGPKNPNGMSPQIYMVIGNDGGHLSSQITSQQSANMGLWKMASEHDQATVTALESGAIGAMPFARGYWKGIGRQTGKVFHGAVYASSSPPYVVQIFCKDTEPSSTQDIPLLEASVQTLHKR